MKSWRRLRSWNRKRTKTCPQISQINADFFGKFFLRKSVKSADDVLLNPQIRQHIADAVDDLDEFRMRLLEAFHRRAQAGDGMFQRLRIFFRARGLVRG